MLLQTRVHISPLRALQALLCTCNLTRWAVPAMLKSSVWRTRNETTWGPPVPLDPAYGRFLSQNGAYVLMLKMTRKMSPPAANLDVVSCLLDAAPHQSKFITNNVFVYALQNREIHTESWDESPGCSLSQNMSTTCPGIPKTALCAMFPCDRKAAAPPAGGSGCVLGLLGSRSGVSRCSNLNLKMR